VVPSDRTRGNGHKLKHRKFQLKMRKNFLPLRVTEPWPRLPREAVESPSLEIFQTCLAAVLCSLLWVTLLGQGVGLGDPQRSLPTPTMLGFCDSVICAWRALCSSRPPGQTLGRDAPAQAGPARARCGAGAAPCCLWPRLLRYPVCRRGRVSSGAARGGRGRRARWAAQAGTGSSDHPACCCAEYLARGPRPPPSARREK